MNPHGEIPEFRRRYRYLVGVVGISFFVLLVRLCQMQVVHGDEYLRKSEDNFVQELRIATVRGVILDRNGRELATNLPSHDVYVIPRFSSPAVLERLAEELALTPDRAAAMKQTIQQCSGQRRWRPQLVARDITRDQLARLETNRADLDGVSIASRPHRNFVHGNLAAHILGYMNEVSADDLSRDRSRSYVPGDMIGRAGVERLYESHLRGVPGRRRVVVDARGRQKQGAEAAELLRGETRVEPKPGQNLVLTIDLEVQRLVERALRNYPAAAAVVLEVNTGRVLASASKPSFDPNLLTGRLSPDEARRMVQDPYRPLLDKVHREHYFPGSTYKVIPAIAALEEGLVDPEEKVLCKGWHSFGRRNFRCSHSHGKVNLRRAIVESCGPSSSHATSTSTPSPSGSGWTPWRGTPTCSGWALPPGSGSTERSGASSRPRSGTPGASSRSASASRSTPRSVRGTPRPRRSSSPASTPPSPTGGRSTCHSWWSGSRR